MSASAKKKKSKYVNILSEKGQTQSQANILLPGRHRCDCEARRHELVNNCLTCGSNKGKELERKLMAGVALAGELDEDLGVEKSSLSLSSISKSLSKAIEEKNKLVRADKDESRTRVIDDQSDYFSSDYNSFMSKEDRDAISKRKTELLELQNRLTRATKVNFDLVGRRVYDEVNNDVDFGNDPVLREIQARNASSGNIIRGDIPQELLDNIKYDYANGEDFPVVSKSCVRSGRIQDESGTSLAPPNMCLSMHQPYASLLVAGIKKHEGRSWYSTHRGKLWIAATVKPVDKNEGQQVEQFYTNIYGANLPAEFPDFYPSSVLLGCVDVLECLPQEEYREKYPNGESDSPYVFVCTNPQELSVKFPVSGQSKIYQLETIIYKAALKIMGNQKK